MTLDYFFLVLKVRQSRNDFFKPTFLPKNEFNFTTMILQVDFFSFIFLEEIEDFKDILKLTDLYKECRDSMGVRLDRRMNEYISISFKN